ncbi:MAG: aldo/keto reductase [Candidatus Thorarchaeota archaeon]|jgi:aryl-alcohol dehydrogenase-like predicted oxidoreductase
MLYKKLGNSGLKVSRFVLGTMQMGWIINEETSFEILDAALEMGINTIDTADIYSKWSEESYPGKSEEIIGKWIKERGIRDDIVLATKVRGEMSNNPNNLGLSRKHILESAKHSLERLQTEWIDLYWSHGPDLEVPQKETLRAFSKLVDDGVAHYIGASNHNGAQVMEALWMSDKYGLVRYDALQPHYSLGRRRDYEKYLMPVIQKYNLGVTSYSPLGGGFLTGRYTREQTPESKRVGSVKIKYFKDRNFRIVETLKELASNYDVTVAQIALAWILSRKTVTAPIIGVNSVEQLNENIDSINLNLSERDLLRLDDVSDWTKFDELAR